MITIKGSHINRELEVTRIYELKKRQRVNMTDALNLDDEAWKTFLDGLKADDPDSNVTRENQWDFDFQWTGTEAGQWIDQQQMPDDMGYLLSGVCRVGFGTPPHRAKRAGTAPRRFPSP